MLIIYLILFAIISVVITIFSSSSDKIFNIREEVLIYEKDLEKALNDIRKYVFYPLLSRFQEQKTLISERNSNSLDQYEYQIGSLNQSIIYLKECKNQYNNFIRTLLLSGILASPSSVLVTVFDLEKIFNENQILLIILLIGSILVVGISMSFHFLYTYRKYKKKFQGIFGSVRNMLDYKEYAINSGDIN
jgi:hypothetical protein